MAKRDHGLLILGGVVLWLLSTLAPAVAASLNYYEEAMRAMPPGRARNGRFHPGPASPEFRRGCSNQAAHVVPGRFHRLK